MVGVGSDKGGDGDDGVAGVEMGGADGSAVVVVVVGGD